MEQSDNTSPCARAGRSPARKYRILSFVGLGIFALLAVLLLITLLMRRQEAAQSESLRELYYSHGGLEALSTAEPDPESGWEHGLTTVRPEDIPERFRELWEINRDLIGWIKAGELADEPVVYRDNEYYLSHSFRGADGGGGTVFADEENTGWPTDPYLILYGHNIETGSMFGKLPKYCELQTLKDNAVIEWDTIVSGHAEEYAVFSVFNASMLPEDPDYFYLRRFDELRRGGPAEMKKLVDELRGRSLFDIPLEVTEDDRILVLVTCSYKDPDGRLMVCCRALRSGETADDISAVIAQSSVR